ncbi:diguanylate cyclase [Micromonospora peucetia]|uniref:Diguanylate cyclase n=1 Tax=Micromonospora peucetia TaxID=47871 RepID=A0A1C6UIV7_9ACTN|nr:diguanylate cyclase [Micromonospora peucetia]MCX4386838.1 diguanylate cyclase [Micromonospora peucetia]WSA34156.1 diguanylate cyclase [Micromonospora peucetia]SCL53996.1 diguanylate cyclase (GGDEF) domain-containing protein [Micromonospora peucetia]
MTLRGRLTTAFLAVALGPVVLGVMFVGATVAAVDASRSTERLAVAAATVRTSVDALCQQLRAAADAVALAGDRPAAASQVVRRGLATAVLVTDVTGRVTYDTPGGPPAPWRDCAGPPVVGPVRALAARADLSDRAGGPLGTVTAAQPVDPAFVARLAAVTGVAVTLLDDAEAPIRLVHSTESSGVRDAVLAAAGTLDGERVTETPDGRYVRRVGPSFGQPLPLVLSVPSERPRGLYVALGSAVLVATLLAVVAAWRLARVTTRPLVELAGAVDRVASGDLTTRVPVRSRDEIGRLAGAFNRMTRETGTYVAALTSSRDQLRGHLAVLGDTLASTHDLQRILRVILHSAIAATGARAGAVLLVDDGGVLVAQCTEGLDGPAAADERTGALRVPLGSGVVGAVAATGEPRRGRVDPSATPPGEPRCRTYIAVPFAAPGTAGPPDVTARGDGPAARPGSEPAAPAGALGVLALYDRLGADEFDDDDLVTLRTFAGHAAVAVDNVRVHEEAQRLSLTDPLTGLWNYRYLRESIRREVERATRFGRMLSVLVLDLDRFKDVNDTHGHAAGDAVLAEFARRMRGEIREVDLAFRQGGEEFVLLLPETDARGAAIVAERLGAAIRDEPIAADGHGGAAVAIGVTVSIGIAVHPDHGGTGQQVLDAADDALYAAKAAGRDTWRIAEARAEAPAREIPVPAAATTPEDGMPRAGAPRQPVRARSEPAEPADAEPGSAPAGPGPVGPGPGGGASSGPHPPRQSRGR